MKKLSIYLLCSIFLCRLIHAEVCHLTLKNVIDAVEQEGFLSRETVEKALQDLYHARGDLLPDVSLIANRQWTKKAAPVNSGGPGDLLFASNIETSTNIGIEGYYSVLNLRKIADYQLAKMGYEISILDYETIKQAVIGEVVKTYFLHQKNIKRMHAIEANINRDQALLEMTQHQLQAGTASALDVTRSQLRLSLDMKQQLQQQTLLFQSEMKLKQLLYLDLNLKLELEDNLLQAPPQTYQPSIPFAFNNRNDLSMAECKLQKDLFECKSTNWEYLPKLEASGNLSRSSATTFDSKQKETWSAAITLSIPIFDGFKTHSDYLKAKASVRAQQYVINDLKIDIMANVMVNQQELLSAYKEINATQDQVQLGKTELEFAKIRFESGAADNLEVIKAQADLASFEEQLVNAEYNYNLKRLNWAQIHGCVQLLLQNP